MTPPHTPPTTGGATGMSVPRRERERGGVPATRHTVLGLGAGTVRIPRIPKSRLWQAREQPESPEA